MTDQLLQELDEITKSFGRGQHLSDQKRTEKQWRSQKHINSSKQKSKDRTISESLRHDRNLTDRRMMIGIKKQSKKSPKAPISPHRSIIRCVKRMFGKRKLYGALIIDASTLFDLIDQDASGNISKQELSGALIRLDAGLTRHQISSFVHRFDTDNTDQLDKKEFLAVFSADDGAENVATIYSRLHKTHTVASLRNQKVDQNTSETLDKLKLRTSKPKTVRRAKSDVHERLYQDTTKADAIQRTLHKMELEQKNNQPRLKRKVTDPMIHLRLHNAAAKYNQQRDRIVEEGKQHKYNKECTFSPKLLKPSRSFYRAKKQHRQFKYARIVQRWWLSISTRTHFVRVVSSVPKIQRFWKRKSPRYRKFCLNKAKRRVATFQAKLAQRKENKKKGVARIFKWTTQQYHSLERFQSTRAIQRWFKLTRLRRLQANHLMAVLRSLLLFQQRGQMELVLRRWKKTRKQYQHRRERLAETIRCWKKAMRLCRRRADKMEKTLITILAWGEYRDIKRATEKWKRYCFVMLREKQEREIERERERAQERAKERDRERKRMNRWEVILVIGLLVLTGTFVVVMMMMVEDASRDGKEVLPEM